jgi:DNA polymerase-1
MIKRPDILLIDADTAAYTACQSSEVEVEHGDWHMVASDFRQAQRRFTDTLKLWKQRWQCDNIEVFLTGRSNFRKLVASSYKGHRLKRKPLGFYRLVKWAMAEHTSHLEEGLEADDLLGLRCHQTAENVLLISMDKDLKQIQCRQWNGTDEITPTLEECDFFFHQQILTGDAVDGYSGCPGIGAVKAVALLNKTPREFWWEAIVGTYVKAGLTEADALQNARLARILRKGEYDWKAHEPTLWTPS